MPQITFFTKLDIFAFFAKHAVGTRHRTKVNVPSPSNGMENVPRNRSFHSGRSWVLVRFTVEFRQVVGHGDVFLCQLSDGIGFRFRNTKEKRQRGVRLARSSFYECGGLGAV